MQFDGLSFKSKPHSLQTRQEDEAPILAEDSTSSGSFAYSWLGADSISKVDANYKKLAKNFARQFARKDYKLSELPPAHCLTSISQKFHYDGQKYEARSVSRNDRFYLAELDKFRKHSDIEEKRHGNDSLKRRALITTKPSLQNISRNIYPLPKQRSSLLSGKSQDITWSRRILQVKYEKILCGMNDVLSQVCGGPLEKVVKYDQCTSEVLEIHFIYPSHAHKFYNYTNTTGFFVVNGHKLRVDWVPCPEHAIVKKSLMHDVKVYGARRCLIFSKEIPGKPLRRLNSIYYPSPTLNYSPDLCIETIKRNFSDFGALVGITSIISSKLSFSLHFFDIESAIFAKSECEEEGTDLHAKYKSWSIQYGKDPTEKTCMVI